MERVKLTREELYDRVWTEPMRTLAPHYGLSDVGLAKTCKRLRVPVPARGYWAKKAAGYTVERLPLPALSNNPSLSDREVTIGYHLEAQDSPTVPMLIRKQAAFESAPENLIVVSDGLRAPHPFVRKTTEVLKGSGRTATELLYNYPESYLDVHVTRPMLPRALRIMDALVKAFEERGWKVSLGSKSRDHDRKSYVTMLNQAVSFGVREKLKKVETHAARDWEAKYADMPSGKLALVIRHSWGYGVEKSWEDTASRRVEDRLNEFIVALFSEAYDELEGKLEEKSMNATGSRKSRDSRSKRTAKKSSSPGLGP